MHETPLLATAPRLFGLDITILSADLLRPLLGASSPDLFCACYLPVETSVLIDVGEYPDFPLKRRRRLDNTPS